ncbi:MAG: hypothetical protein BGO41_14495 [Clostridiales bacterium 38-18]|nr:MAG: hypothetical protein BGO41_14495 [Clostridiales bacterium 38-18]
METSIINWFQSIQTPFLDRIFILITLLGEEYFYILVLGIAYWCVSKKNTVFIVYCLTFSSVINSALKEMFNELRPFQVLDIRALRVETATGTSFPSGHTQTVTAFYVAVASLFKKKWLWGISAIIPFLVGVSRIYLGVHWPKDVLGGWLIGILSVVIVTWILRNDNKMKVQQMTLFLVVLSVVSLIFFTSENYVKAVAAFSAFIIGQMMEEKWVSFSTKTNLTKQFVKIVLGMSITAGVFIGLKAILPDENMFIGIRYLLTVFSVAFVAPYIFTKIGLSDRIEA